MARPGFLGSNVANNVQVPGGVGFFFKETGSSDWLDLGALTGVSIEPTIEFLEYSTNRRGVNALAKRILTSRGLSISATLEEVNPDNLRLAFFGGANTTPSSGVAYVDTEAPLAFDGGVTSGDDFAWDLTVANATVLSVKSADGGTEYTEGGGNDYTVSATGGSGGVTRISAVAGGSLETASSVGHQIHVTYSVNSGTTDVEVSEILDDTSIVGAGQFIIRNPGGGLLQIYEFDQIEVAPAGAIDISADAVQSIPLTLTVQELNGKFGRIYTKTVS